MWTSKLFVLALTFFRNCKKSNAESGGYLFFKENGAIFLKINHHKNWDCCFRSQFTVSMNSDHNKLLSFCQNVLQSTLLLSQLQSKVSGTVSQYSETRSSIELLEAKTILRNSSDISQSGTEKRPIDSTLQCQCGEGEVFDKQKREKVRSRSENRHRQMVDRELAKERGEEKKTDLEKPRRGSEKGKKYKRITSS